ncbi:retinal pigment epithelial membrane family protein [Mycobacterium ulcerans str. Harvey]|uniref:Dioxygenase n=1 Tax=Mycobacterium ulcerans str. Harvey TaxID=1299332 RepID=A0ABP3APH5_MYCUL|nr:retinal pigment epithelial membrane family protein [Mycobacterium ulcerans str. Harvey]
MRAEVTATDLEVTGRIPDYLDGRYLRNGPNPVAEVNPATYHWFTGDGMVHGVALRDGRASWYRNRWVRSMPVCAALGSRRPPGSTPGGHAGAGANTNVLSHAGRTLALVEGASQTMSSPTTSTPWAPATSTAPCPAVTPPIRTATPRPASCTRCPTRLPAGTWCSTR